MPRFNTYIFKYLLESTLQPKILSIPIIYIFLPLSFSLPHAAFELNVVAKSEVGLGSGCFLLLLRFVVAGSNMTYTNNNTMAPSSVRQ